MLALTKIDPWRVPELGEAGCPQADPEALVRRLTGLRVVGAQVISDPDARQIAEELVATVRCNAYAAAEQGARSGARRALLPALVVSVLGAIAATTAAVVAARRSG